MATIQKSYLKLIALMLCLMLTATMLPAIASADLATPVLTGATASGSGITVNWNAVSGAEAYRVFRKQSGSGWSGLGNTSSTSYMDKTAKAGVTYTYTVRCVVGGQMASGYDNIGVSAAWSESTAGYTSTPALVSATGESNGIRFKWKKVSGATGYRVFRKPEGGKWSGIATTGDTDNYLDTGAAAGTKFIYTVRSMKDGKIVSDYDHKGVSGSWNASSDLATPKLVSATAEGSGIRVTWQSVSGAYAYRLYRRIGSAKWERLADVKGTSYLDNATKENTKYTYTVRCINTNGQNVSGFDRTGVTASWNSGASGDYSTPVLRKISYSGNTVNITWDAVPGAPAYRVFRKTGNGKWQGLANTSTNSYTDSSVVSGNKYTYTARVVDAKGKMASGYDSTGISINFYAVPALVSANSGADGIVLTWKAAAGAPRYLIYRKSGGGSYIRIANTSETSYTDTSIVMGVTYNYTVRVVSNDLKELLGDYDHKGINAWFVGKAEVSSATAETNGVLVKWGKLSGATSYVLQRRFGAGGWTNLLTTADTSYTDPNVVNGITYTYRVRALDSSAKYIGTYDENGKSVTYYATPTLISCVRTDGGLQTTWEAVEGVSNYAVFRKIGSGTWMNIGYTSSTYFTDYTVPSGTLCYYTVRCADAAGGMISSYNKSGIGETSYMDTPVLQYAGNGDGYVTIEWQSVDKANNYKVYRRTGARSSWLQIGTTSDEYFDDFNVVNGGTYYYTVSTCDAAGNDMSLYDNTGLNVTYYAVPVLKGAENVASGAQVSWYAVDGVNNYRIYRKTGNSGWAAFDTATGTSYVDTTVVSNANYWYSVSCIVNGTEVSARDYSGVSTTFYETPVMGSITNQAGKIQITWNPVDGIGSYRVYRKVNSGSWTDVATVNGLSYTDSNVSTGNKYTYTARCMSGGSVVSGYESTVSTRYLAVPTVTAASKKVGEVTLNWTKISGASKYKIYRKTAATNWTEIATTGDTASFTDSGLKSGGMFTYAVSAIDNDGSASARSSAVNCTVK